MGGDEHHAKNLAKTKDVIRLMIELTVSHPEVTCNESFERLSLSLSLLLMHSDLFFLWRLVV
jgi:hypothetical protein